LFTILYNTAIYSDGSFVQKLFWKVHENKIVDLRNCLKLEQFKLYISVKKESFNQPSGIFDNLILVHDLDSKSLNP